MMFSSMISISFIIIFIKHRLSLGFSILMYTTLISWTSGVFSSFWYSYIIFSVLIGGSLVLFIYMTKIASNEKFKTNIFLFLSMSMIFHFMLMMLYWYFMMILYYFMLMNLSNKMF